MKKINDENFVRDYLNDFSISLLPNKEIVDKIIQVKNILQKTSNRNGKVLIFGNGGSAAISSHVSIDLTKTQS